MGTKFIPLNNVAVPPPPPHPNARARTPMRTHTYTYTHTHIHTYTHTYTHTHTHARTHARARAHVYSLAPGFAVHRRDAAAVRGGSHGAGRVGAEGPPSSGQYAELRP